MKIQEFENKVRPGSKIKIQCGHVRNGHVHKEFEPGIWTFMGYEKCPIKCGPCPGYIILMDENGYKGKGCYRNFSGENIRLQFITWNLPDSLFEI